MSLWDKETRAYSRDPTYKKVGKSRIGLEIEITLRFGLFRFVAPSNARASRFALWGPPMSTLKPSAPFFPMTAPMTASRAEGIY